MIARWDNGSLKFITPVDGSHQHIIIIVEHSQTRKMSFSLKKGCTTEEFAATNCDGNSFRSHDYHVVMEKGENYCLDVLYDDNDCTNGNAPGKTPKPIPLPGIGAFLGSFQVDQWRLAAENGTDILCGITIIVIDDMVGPDGSALPSRVERKLGTVQSPEPTYDSIQLIEKFERHDVSYSRTTLTSPLSDSGRDIKKLSDGGTGSQS